MITQTGVIRYCEAMNNAGCRYVWGADMQVITADLIDSLMKKYGASHYNRNKLLQYEGMLGGDCSGFLTPISGLNITAADYYSRCSVKGSIDQMPLNRVCLVFQYKEKSITHVGVSTADGFTYEMYSGCDKKKFSKTRWTHFGIPNWISYTGDSLVRQVRLERASKGYMTSKDALEGKNEKTIVASGVYFVYNDKHPGTLNVTTKAGVPGSWIRWEE